MKSKIILLATLLFFANSIWAVTFSYRNIYYRITNSNIGSRTVEVTRAPNPYTGNISIPSQVIYINNGYGYTYTVTRIGDSAFYNNTSLTSVSLHDTITSIGNYAFYGCTNLTSISIPVSTTSLGNYAFYRCTNLTSVSIPVSTPITRIEDYTFYNCYSMSTCTIPNSVTAIGNYAFNNCDNLTNFTIPNSVTTVGNYGLYRVSASAGNPFMLPNSITSIGAYAFWGSRVQNIPTSLSSIADFAFAHTSDITTAVIPNNVTRIGRGAFYRSNFSSTIPNRVAYIGPGAFAYCNRLPTSLTIPNSITRIEDSVFKCAWGGGPSNVNLTIPNTVTNIGYSAFSGVDRLHKLSVSSSVANIGVLAFNDCRYLDTVVFLGRTNLGAGCFSGCSSSTNFHNITLIVPCESIGWYQSQISYAGIVTNWYTLTGQGTFPYSYSASSQNNMMGRVTTETAPTCQNGFAWTVSATPNSGYTFSRWSDGNTQNPRTLTVTQDTVLIAYFASNQSIVDAENDIISIRTANGHILLEGINGEQAYVTDVLGRVVYNATVNERAEIAVKNQGIYFVKIGSRPAQKVVVIR